MDSETKLNEEQTIEAPEASAKVVKKSKAPDMNAYLNEKVSFYAFKDNDKYKDDIIVGINGKTFQIKRGIEVMIPRYVRDIIVQSMDQDARTAELIEKKTSEYARSSKIYE